MQDLRSSGAGRKILHSLVDICFPVVASNLVRYNEFPITLPFPVRQTLIEMSIAKKTLTDKTLHLFLHPSTVHLDLSGTTTITDEGIEKIRQTCPNLKHLSLSRCTNVTPTALLQLFKHLATHNQSDNQQSTQDNGGGLISVDLSRCIRVNDSVVKEGLNDCFPGSLHGVNLSRCAQITASSVIPLLRSCSESLREINLFGCNKLNNSIWEPLSLCTNLRSIILSRCFLLSDDATKGQLAKVLNNCKNLEVLNLSRLKGIHDSALVQIANSACASSLVFLDFTSSTTLSNASVQAIARRCTSLQTLYLSNVRMLTDETICIVAQHCTRLKLLYVSSLSLIADTAILEMANHLKGLQTLNISRCNLVTDSSVCELAKNCRLLKTVYLSHCTQLTGKVLKLRKKCHNLTSLDVSGCAASMTDSSLGALDNIARMKNMQILDLSQSRNLSLEGIKGIGDNLYKLTLLSLTETNLTNEDLRMLSQGYLPSLNWLSFCTCPGVNDLEVVHELLDNLPSLSKLYISGCPFFDENEEREKEKEEGKESENEGKESEEKEEREKKEESEREKGNESDNDLGKEKAGSEKDARRKEKDEGAEIKNEERKRKGKRKECLNMEHFFISGCAGMSDRMAQGLIERMPNLQTLVLSQCEKLTDATFCRLAEECRHIQHLGLADCSEITDKAIDKIAENLGGNDLLSLTVSHCHRISAKGFFSVLKRSKHLQSIFASGSTEEQWPDSILEQVSDLCPSLMILVLSLNKRRKELAKTANPNLEVS